MRFFLIGWLIWKFGAPIKGFIDKYFNTLALIFTVLLVGITVLTLGLLGKGDTEENRSKAPAKSEVVIEEQRDNTDNDIDTLTIVEPCDTLD